MTTAFQFSDPLVLDPSDHPLLPQIGFPQQEASLTKDVNEYHVYIIAIFLFYMNEMTS